MQFTAFTVSLILHLALIVFSASYTGISRPKPIDLSRDIQMVELVYMPSPAVQAPEPPAPAPPEPPQPQPVPQPVQPKVEIPRSEPEPRPQPEPRPDPKPEPKPEPRPEPRPQPAPKPEPARERTPTREEIMAQELAALRKDVERSTAGQAPREQAGLLEIYAALAEEHIKRNWRFPRLGGSQNLVVRVEVEIDSTGMVVSRRIVRSSGREDFDHSALRAIDDTGRLPEPPSARIRTLVIDFNLQDLVSFLPKHLFTKTT